MIRLTLLAALLAGCASAPAPGSLQSLRHKCNADQRLVCNQAWREYEWDNNTDLVYYKGGTQYQFCSAVARNRCQ